MWEPQPLTTLRASKACRGEDFTFTFIDNEYSSLKYENSCEVADVHEVIESCMYM
jgi:hypothetical protein